MIKPDENSFFSGPTAEVMHRNIPNGRLDRRTVQEQPTTFKYQVSDHELTNQIVK